MKNFEALAIGVIAGAIVSSICCDKKVEQSKKPTPCPKETSPCIKKPDCKKCYYQRYYANRE